jgi:hypothetical protein
MGGCYSGFAAGHSRGDPLSGAAGREDLVAEVS